MSVQILDIVLYSHDGRKRVLSLKPGKVNVITGASQTGKSAISDIIDCCFGSGECHVAHGPLRLHVSWYGLRLQLASEQAFVARRCPAPKAQTSDEEGFDTPKAQRALICRVLRLLPDQNNWTDYPNVADEVEHLITNCEWFRVYDIAEAFYAEAAAPRRGFGAPKGSATEFARSRP